MQEPNADPDYEQNALERVLLNPGWTFTGIQPFSTGPWKPWAFVLLILVVIVAVAFYFVLYTDSLG